MKAQKLSETKAFPSESSEAQSFLQEFFAEQNIIKYGKLQIIKHCIYLELFGHNFNNFIKVTNEHAITTTSSYKKIFTDSD